MRVARTAGLLLVMLWAWLPAAGAQDTGPAGVVSRVQGSALAVKNAMPRILAPGDPVGIGDVLSTGVDSRLEIVLADDTVFTLGAEASFVVVDYTFGRGGENNRTLRILNGAFLVATGAGDADDRFVVKTPVATIGIRGTTFWGGPLDGDFQIMVVDGAGIVVSTGEGQVTLGPGDGTRIPAGGGAPTDPAVWPDEKVARAQATVAFTP